MAKKFAPPVEITFASLPGPIRFDEVAEAKAWVENEAQVWGPYCAEPWSTIGSPYWSPLNRLRKAIGAMRSAISTAEGTPGDTVAPGVLTKELEAYNNECLPSDSPLGKRALAIFSAATSLSDRRTAAAFFAAGSNQNVAFSAFAQSGDSAVPWFLGMAEYVSLSPSTTLDARQLLDQTIEATSSKWNSVLNEQKSNHLRQTEEIQKVHELIHLEHTTQKEAFAVLTDQHKSKLKEIEVFYTEGLRTQAPTKYWSSKARSHTVIGYIAFAVFAVAGFVLMATAYNLGENVVAALGAQGAATDPANAQFVSLETALSRFLVFVVPSFFAVWLLRTILRIALSNLALADDARHRVTLIQTFRSLLEHEDKLEAPDRILMLQALFRPSPGSGDDDSAPPNWFDVLVSRIKPNP